jgi:hypothetical protein
VSRAPVFDSGGSVLKALFLVLCVVVLTTQIAAAANGERSATASRVAKASSQDGRALPLEQRLDLKLKAARKHRSTIRFFETHRKLVLAADRPTVALAALRRATRGLARVTKEIAYYRRLIGLRDAKRQARRLAAAPPRVAICGVFGKYCRQALSVARCESHLSTRAQNGQYRGLFQMGSSERRLFGHGDSAHQQALAAHRYFVRSGRDWSPWSCRWAAS